MKPFIQFLLGFVLFITNACTTRQIIRNAEYSAAEASFRSGDVEQAVARFPPKEPGGFVTSVEKSWLGFWTGQKNNDDLLKQVSTLDQRRYTSISREAQYFFYNESEDGYIPAEHEIIVMHLLNSMLFMRQEKWDEARVEVRRAVFFLQNYFREDQEHFDDPALRLWLAGIWAALGEWPSAQVDLRKAYELSQNKALLPLIDLQSPPSQFAVVFTGGGPVVTWKDGEAVPTFTNETARPAYAVSFETMPWYRRHVLRNTEIRDVITKSNYMTQYYGLQASTTAEKTIGQTVAAGLKTTGVILGTAIVVGAAAVMIALAAQSSQPVSPEAWELMGYTMAGGYAVGSALWDEGGKVSDSNALSVKRRKEEGLENLKTYRYVRFMPNWISVTDTYEEQKARDTLTSLQAPRSKTKVLFLHQF